MTQDAPRKARVGGWVDDLCRACKLVRKHTVMAAASDGTIHRVVCDYCGSQHNYRGGGPAPRASGGPGRPPARPERFRSSPNAKGVSPR